MSRPIRNPFSLFPSDFPGWRSPDDEPQKYRPDLRRFDIRVLRDHEGEPPPAAQVPAEGAKISLFRQGATTSNPATVTIANGSSAEVPVHDVGGLRLNDVVRVGLSGYSLTVLAILEDPTSQNPTKVTLSNATGVAVPIDPGTRLLPLSDPRPTFTDNPDPRGQPGANSFVLTKADGRAGSYVVHPPGDKINRFDYLITGGGLASDRLHIDALGGLAPHPSWLNAGDFPSIQAAIDALPPQGGVVFIPAGRHVLAGGIVITKQSVTLRGEGTAATLITRDPGPDAFDLVTVRALACRIYDLQLDGAGSSTRCLTLTEPQPEESGSRSGHALVRNVVLRGSSAEGLWVAPSLICLFVQVHCVENAGSGAQLDFGTTSTRFIDCTFARNGRSGAFVGGAHGVLFLGCLFDSNLGNTLSNEGNALFINGPPNQLNRVMVIGCRFVRTISGGPQPHQFVFGLQSESLMVQGCYFDGGVETSSRPVQAAGFRFCPGVQFSSNTARNMQTRMVEFIGDPDTALRTSEVLEYCNQDLDSPSSPRIKVDPGVRAVGLSRGALEVFRTDDDPEMGPLDGGIAWVNTDLALKVLRTDPLGRAWQEVELEP